MFAIRARRKVATERDFLDAVEKVIRQGTKFSSTCVSLMFSAALTFLSPFSFNLQADVSSVQLGSGSVYWYLSLTRYNLHENIWKDWPLLMNAPIGRDLVERLVCNRDDGRQAGVNRSNCYAGCNFGE